MAKSKLPDWNIFQRITNRNENIVACFDLLMTRRRISSCKSTRELRDLGASLKQLAKDAYEELLQGSKTVTVGHSWLRSVKYPQDYSSCVKTILIQDTLIIIFDLQRAVKRKIMSIDIDIGTFFQFALASVDNVYDSLLEHGYLARAAISSGSLYYNSNQVLGTSFINAYDSIEGSRRLPLVAVEVCSEFARFQNWINDYLEHIHCSMGEYLAHGLYLPHRNRIFIDPNIPDIQTFEQRLAILQINGCNEAFLHSTADLLIESFKRNSRQEFDAHTESILEDRKYHDWTEMKSEVINEFHLLRMKKKAQQIAPAD